MIHKLNKLCARDSIEAIISSGTLFAPVKLVIKERSDCQN
jgi:hypothetical protein